MLKHELEDGLATLKNLNAQQYYTCPTIADDVIQKLPRQMKRDWGRYAYSKLQKEPGTASLEDVVRWVDHYSRWIIWITECDEFKASDVQNRWKVAKANNLCFCCLKVRHKDQCTQRKQCGIQQCDRFHHRLLNKHTTSESLHAVVGENNSASVHYRIVPVQFV
jgi:hypothetical protein